MFAPTTFRTIAARYYTQDRDGNWWFKHAQNGWTRVNEASAHFRVALTTHTKASITCRRNVRTGAYRRLNVEPDLGMLPVGACAEDVLGRHV